MGLSISMPQLLMICGYLNNILIIFQINRDLSMIKPIMSRNENPMNNPRVTPTDPIIPVSYNR